MDRQKPQKFVQTKPYPGSKVFRTSAWGCMIFFVVMLFGTWSIGHYVGRYLKKKHDEELAHQQLLKFNKSHPQTLPVQTSILHAKN